MHVIRWILGVCVLLFAFFGLLGTWLDRRRRRKGRQYALAIVLMLIGFAIVPVRSNDTLATTAPAHAQAAASNHTAASSAASAAGSGSGHAAAAAGTTQNAAQRDAATANATTAARTVTAGSTNDTIRPTGTLIPVVVSKETDGDTIHVRMGGKDYTVRMLLIDTPEDVKPDTPVEPYSLEAAAYARQVLPVGKHIYIQEGKPGATTDKYGRLLAYVFVTKTDMYNEDVVRKGLARVAYVEPPNTDYLPQLDAAQAYAKSHHLDIWSIPGYVTPTGYSVSVALKWDAAHHYGQSSSTTGGSGSASSSSSTAHSGGSSARQATASNTAALKVVASQLTVAPDNDASVTIQTSPGTAGKIEVDYKSGPSHAHGLEPETANSQGRITWRWLVGSNTTPGTWPVHITAGGHSITVYLHVT
ncbi:thermonuclease family protein [Alicyclobacillus cycloheptanicus]|uniref:Micrococcal nuclease n=1 Tax=Alicyclobacillus cycloheptanicus TaxID=1457 RepID=A0ABT9XJ91_9BACL|nr:thermonuclease family protein [Alicyclobacillus cycloheptanicus]MDQ0190348.1 micrococcal nuclease [Alicyclobacillus cycloheptanicus]WDM00015.1 thermonuclease family protein [Alicyclobacillus cycloheptanicus]